jgi:CrcB protein
MTPAKFNFGGVVVFNILIVGIGGFIGSALRYLVSGWAQQWSKSLDFPYGTLTVNLIGCFLIGLLGELAEARGILTSETRLLVLIGLLGGFTTFSSFGNDTLNLARSGQMVNALGNVAANVVFGLLLVWLGRMVAYLLWR